MLARTEKESTARASSNSFDEDEEKYGGVEMRGGGMPTKKGIGRSTGTGKGGKGGAGTSSSTYTKLSDDSAHHGAVAAARTGGESNPYDML